MMICVIYMKKIYLCNLYEEDLKEIKRWREENPDWEIDVARREIRKKFDWEK